MKRLSPMTRRKIQPFVLVALLSALLIGCDAAPERVTAPEAVRVRTQRATVETITPTYTGFGSITFIRKADIYPMTEGIVRELAAEESDRVRVGRRLASIDDTQLRISLSQAQADLASAEAELALTIAQLDEGELEIEARLVAVEGAQLDLVERLRDLERSVDEYTDAQRLFSAGGISQSQLDEAEDQLLTNRASVTRARNELALQSIGLRDGDILAAGLTIPSDPQSRRDILIELGTATLRAQVAVARTQVARSRLEIDRVETLLEDTIITSPIDGIVGARYVELGELVTTENPVFTIFDSSRVYADINVSEEDIGQLANGQSGTVKVPALGMEFVGEVARVAPLLTPGTRSGRVRVLIPNPDRRLTPGMFVEVEVETGQPQEMVLVPSDAVFETSDGTSALYVVRSDRLFQIEVEVGPTVDEGTAIRSGLDRGESVVASPNDLLRDGLLVEVIE